MKLLGFVDKGNERLVITEFVPNGTLREHLDGKFVSTLSDWSIFQNPNPKVFINNVAYASW